MKKSSITLSAFLALGSFSAFANVSLPVKISCEYEIRKNSTDLKVLKKSVAKREVSITDLWAAEKVQLKFKRIVPFLNSPDDDKKTMQKNLVKRKDERVILFKSDKAEESIENSILYGIGKVDGRLLMKFSVDKINDDGSKVILFNTMNPTGTLHGSKRLKRITLEPGDEETIEMKEQINFQYTDYSYKGFLGISGWFNDEVEVTGKKRHMGEVKYKCEFSMPEQEDIADEIEAEDIDPTGGDAEELSGFAIERNPTVTQE